MGITGEIARVIGNILTKTYALIRGYRQMHIYIYTCIHEPWTKFVV